LAILYFRLGAPPADPIADWRAHAIGLAAPGRALPGVAGALRAQALDTVPARGALYVASPVHLVAGLNGVSLARNGLLALSAAEAAQLAADFNALFGAGGVRLVRARHERLLCAFEGAPPGSAPPGSAPAPPPTSDPEQLLGEDIREHLPAGAAGAPLRRLMSELEMWLHGHPLNAARRARRLPEIASLWLWGGADAEQPLPELPLWSHGEDPLFASYAPQSRYPGAGGRAAPSGVVVRSAAPGEDGWERFESEWLGAALKDLRAGRLERIVLCAGRLSRTLSRPGAYRWWRRALPWWESLPVPLT